MTTSIKTYVSRFHAATQKEDSAIVTRIRAVNGMRIDHSLKAADVSRALFSMPADAKLTSRETSPVSHATTVHKLASILSEAAYSDDAIVRSLFSISTGRVPAKTAEAAAQTLHDSGETVTPEAVAEMVATLTAPKPRKVGGTPAGKGKKETPAPAETIVVATPATLPELLAELETQLLAIPDLAARATYINKVANLVQRHRAMIDQSRTEKATAAVKAPAKARKVTVKA